MFVAPVKAPAKKRVAKRTVNAKPVKRARRNKARTTK
jgi:hypothetical protein